VSFLVQHHHKPSVFGRFAVQSIDLQNAEKAQKSSGFWAFSAVRLYIKDVVLIDSSCATGMAAESGGEKDLEYCRLNTHKNADSEKSSVVSEE
jgi:hypothetical protein